jgi:moderate conductance mechanosensitive channel
MWYRLFEAPPAVYVLVAALALTLVGAYLIAFVASRILRGTLVAIVGGPRVATAASPTIRRPVRLIGAMLFVLASAALFFPLAEALGARPRAGLPLRALSDWFFASGLRVLLIAVLAYVTVRILDLLVTRFEDDLRQVQGLDAVERAKRIRTLGGLLHKVVAVAVSAIAVLMILRELRLDIMPLLTGAGIAGLAIGFGAQTLVKDLIAGFFLTFEDQVRVGDVIGVGEVGGLVEEINLRTIVLRGFDGTVHIVPAGSIDVLSNRAKDFAFALLDVAVGYEADADQVIGVLKEVGAGLRADPAWQPHVLADVEVVGIENMADWSVVIRLRIKTAPLQQWNISRELRKRIKKAFETNGIRIPFPRQEVVLLKGEVT